VELCGKVDIGDDVKRREEEEQQEQEEEQVNRSS
jgi:hypothetical protein